MFVEIPLTTSANSVSSTSEGSAAGGRAGETVVLGRERIFKKNWGGKGFFKKIGEGEDF